MGTMADAGDGNPTVLVSHPMTKKLVLFIIRENVPNTNTKNDIFHVQQARVLTEKTKEIQI